jgi:hypothetical protein
LPPGFTEVPTVLTILTANPTVRDATVVLTTTILIMMTLVVSYYLCSQ